MKDDDLQALVAKTKIDVKRDDYDNVPDYRDAVIKALFK